MADLVLPARQEAIAQLDAEVAAAARYAAASRAPNTRRAYAADLKAFSTWCASRGLGSLPAPPEVVGLYLAHLADSGRKPATIDRALAAIAQAHRLAGHESPRSAPAVREVRAGIRRVHGVAPHQKAPLLLDALRRLLERLPDDLGGIRDRALLLAGWASACRRSELAALDVADGTVEPAGLLLMIRRSKRDQEGKGRQVLVPRGKHASTCPVGAVEAWLAASAVREGALFRSVSQWGHVGGRLSGRDVARIVKRAAGVAGMTPEQMDRLAGHSLRAGFATEAARAGKGDRAIMRQTGHRDPASLARYVRDAELINDNAAEDLGL